MSETLKAGWFPDETSQNGVRGTIRVFAWQAPQFCRVPPFTGKTRSKIYPLKDIVVSRWASQQTIHGPNVMWADGTTIWPHERRRFPKKVQKAIRKAIEQTKKIVGG